MGSTCEWKSVDYSSCFFFQLTEIINGSFLDALASIRPVLCHSLTLYLIILGLQRSVDLIIDINTWLHQLSNTNNVKNQQCQMSTMSNVNNVRCQKSNCQQCHSNCQNVNQIVKMSMKLSKCHQIVNQIVKMQIKL